MTDQSAASELPPILDRITTNPDIFGGKSCIRGRRLAAEHVLAMLDAGDSVENILTDYDWLEIEDICACLLWARRRELQQL